MATWKKVLVSGSNASVNEITASGTVTVGVSGTGHDIRFHSNTANEGFFYDASQDELGLLLTTKLKFHDIGGGEEIYASANGHLEINAGTTLDITAPTVDINASTQLNVDGPTEINNTFTVGSSVGPTGYDVIFYGDTAAAAFKWNDEQNTGLTIGADGTGADVKFFGDTASRYWLWDQDADAVVQRATLTVGVDDTGHDVKFYGATAKSFLHWEESTDTLILSGSNLNLIGGDSQFGTGNISGSAKSTGSFGHLFTYGDVSSSALSTGSFGRIDMSGTGSFGRVEGDGSGLTSVSVDIDSLSALGGTGVHQTQDHFIFSDNGTEKKITFSNLQDAVFADVSSDILIAAGGAATIQANSVALGTDTTGDYVQNITGGTGIDSDGATSGENIAHTLTLDLSEVTVAAIADGDYLTFVDVTNSSGSAQDSVHDLATLFSGTGLSAASSVMSVDAAQTSITSIINSGFTDIGTAADQEYIKFDTSNEVNTMINNTERLSVTAAGVDITGAATVSTNLTVNGNTILGNASSDTVTITGNLEIIGGTTTSFVSQSHLQIGDGMIFLATGSKTTNIDAGLIVQHGVNDLTGSAFFHDTSAARWAVAVSASSTTTTMGGYDDSIVTAYVATISSSAGAGAVPGTNEGWYGVGEMTVNTSDQTIWIRTA